MRRSTFLLAVGTMLAAFSPLRTLAAANTWNNGSANSQWDLTSANWTSPTIWAQLDDAIFGGTGAGTVNLNDAIMAGNLTFNADGYSITATPGDFLTLSNATPTITVNNSATIAASIQGANGLTIQGTTNLTLLGDTGFGVANQYTGGTYVKGGTLILQCVNASSSGVSYAIDSIEALDTGATVRMGTLFNGTSWGSQRDQIAAQATGSHLKMTGGTLDLYNDPKNQRVPVPDGFGTIINTGPDVQAGLLMIADGQNHVFSGVIADGGPLIGGNAGQGPGHQIGIVSFAGSKNGGGGELTLSGVNTYSGSTRIDQGASIKLEGAGTLGVPSTNGLTGPLRIYGPGHLDLNGTSQTIALMTGGNSSGQIYNSAVGTVSTLTFGFGNEQANRNANMQFIDNPGTGGTLALTKIGTNCAQTLSGVNTYSGDTIVSEGSLIFSTTTAVSPKTHFRLFTNGSSLALNYAGDVVVGGLYINGVRMPAGTYGSSTAPITGTGTITVPPPNTWNNASSDFLWNETSANWTLPPTWVEGSDAIFGTAGAGVVSLAMPIAAHNLTFNAAGYNINGNGNNLTLIDSNTTVTVNSTASIGATIQGTNGLTVRGTANLILLGDAGLSVADQYTGGTYVRSGTLILRAAGVSASGAAYAVDSLEAIDAGATVQIGTLNDGVNNVRPADGQIKRLNGFGRLNLTGGTFDNNGDNNGIVYPPPSGTGTIVNSSPYIRGVMKLQGTDGATYVFNGQIKDGGLNVTTSQGVAYQQSVDMNSGVYTLVLGGSNSFTGFLRMNNNNHKVILQPGGTLGYAAPINCPARQILMNSGTIDLNGTSQKVGYVYTGNDANSVITNSAHGTTSILTVCYNCTNLVAFNGVATPRGIRSALLDDPATSGTLALTKEGVALQPIGNYSGDGTPAPNNYHGDTTVNNGILEVLSTGGISPNSAYRLNTTQGKLQLDYAGTANIKQLYINGVQQANGIYGSAQTSAITGAGTLTVTGATARPTLGISQSGNTLTFSWTGSFKLQAQTNSVSIGLSSIWFDYPGGATSPVNVTLDRTKGSVFFRLSN